MDKNKLVNDFAIKKKKTMCAFQHFVVTDIINVFHTTVRAIVDDII